MTSGVDRGDVDPRRYVYGVALVGGAANVIMQLAQRPVGRGVVESTVASGSVLLHPVKRARTTVTYLAVALLGTNLERQRYRDAVNGSHAQVRSRPGSPVAYTAFDPGLQLWVAACLYRGLLDVTEAMRLDIGVAADEEFLSYASRLGTTLQVPLESWPPTIAAFWDYWRAAAQHIEIDDETRAYLHSFVTLENFAAPISSTVGRLNYLVTRGLLPPAFRAAMRYDWTPRDQRRFTRVMTALGVVTRCTPAPLRRFPFNACLWDMRRRMKGGRPLV